MSIIAVFTINLKRNRDIFLSVIKYFEKYILNETLKVINCINNNIEPNKNKFTVRVKLTFRNVY